MRKGLVICHYHNKAFLIFQDLTPVCPLMFAKKVNAAIEAIPKFPKAGRVVPEYGDENLREKIYGNYRIVYRLKEKLVEIVAICHGSKPLDDIL